uniref:Uncharacterized protein n=1 Tax=Timema bartmani TaxID=61472 RepID=A0A7R9F8H1_9NEOP|nr:unnamed protein product [Timema bartmani]
MATLDLYQLRYLGCDSSHSQHTYSAIQRPNPLSFQNGQRDPPWFDERHLRTFEADAYMEELLASTKSFLEEYDGSATLGDIAQPVDVEEGTYDIYLKNGHIKSLGNISVGKASYIDQPIYRVASSFLIGKVVLTCDYQLQDIQGRVYKGSLEVELENIQASVQVRSYEDKSVYITDLEKYSVSDLGNETGVKFSDQSLPDIIGLQIEKVFQIHYNLSVAERIVNVLAPRISEAIKVVSFDKYVQ